MSSAVTPGRSRTAATAITPTAITPTGAPTSAAASSASKLLSSKVMGMKFMQRANEGQLRGKLESERDAATAAQQWTAPTPTKGATTTNTDHTPNTNNSTPATLTSNTPNPFRAPALPSRPSIFIPEADTSATPSLPYSAYTNPIPPVAPSVHTPFVAGRRSFGQFNATVDSLVAEATAQSEAEAKGIKLESREKKNSISDSAMADAYVGLRGKAAQRKSGGFSAAGGGGGGAKQQHKKSQSSKKHKRTGDEEQRPKKKQKQNNGNR